MWMELEGIMLNEISQLEKQIPYDLSYIFNIKNKTDEDGESEEKIK